MDNREVLKYWLESVRLSIEGVQGSVLAIRDNMEIPGYDYETLLSAIDRQLNRVAMIDTMIKTVSEEELNIWYDTLVESGRLKNIMYGMIAMIETLRLCLDDDVY